MGKRQHQKDKMYLTYTEWSQFYGGAKTANAENEHIKFKRLPYDHCSITIAPFEHPYCDRDGNCFELAAIVAFLKAFKINPITGKPQDAKSLVRLNFHRSPEDGTYQCPSLFKQFSKNSHIVAVATTGNVFSWEAIEQLNIKTKNWKDLVDDTPFTRKDLITIQDPNVLEKFNISTFHYIRKKLRVMTEEERAERKDPQARLKCISSETRDILSQLERDYKPSTSSAAASGDQPAVADRFNAAHYSTGAVAASFTSTAMVPVSQHEAAILADDEVRYERVKKKGYVRLMTTQGPLNFELFCDVVPKTCENFMRHCTAGYYDGTVFHRSIKNFMIQGGDPTGTGHGGKSIWTEKFDDEIKPQLSHTGRGILSMANSGPNTNGSQFFITYRSCRNLDGKHTIFGKVVGGLDTLNEMEKIEVDNRDRPIEDIVLQRAEVFVDPFKEADEQLAEQRSDELEQKRLAVVEEERRKQRAQPAKVYRQGVGKYLNKEAAAGATASAAAESMSASTAAAAALDLPVASVKKAKRSADYRFNDFSAW